MSTPSLRLATARAGHVCGAGHWRSTVVVTTVARFVLHPLSYVYLDASCGGALRWVPWLKAGQGLAWMLLFARSHRDQKGFISRAALTLAILPSMVFYSAWVSAWDLRGLSANSRLHCVPDSLDCFFLGPIMLSISLGGIAGTAGVAIIGPIILRLVFPADTRKQNSSATIATV